MTVTLDAGKALENSETLYVAAYDENYNLTNVSVATKEDAEADGTYILYMNIPENAFRLHGIILEDTDTIKPVCEVFSQKVSAE